MGRTRVQGGNWKRKITRMAIRSWSRQDETLDEFKDRMVKAATESQIGGKPLSIGTFELQQHPIEKDMRWNVKLMEQHYA